MLVAWLEQAGFADVMRDEGTLVELGVGSGAALLPHARSFPNAQSTGIDLDAGSVQTTSVEAKSLRLNNVLFDVRDVIKSTHDGLQDIVLIFEVETL